MTDLSTLNADLISWEGLEGATEVSTLFGPVLSVPRAFRLKWNERDGDAVTFLLERREDRDGDTIAWYYVAANRGRLKITVFND